MKNPMKWNHSSAYGFVFLNGGVKEWIERDRIDSSTFENSINHLNDAC